MKSQFPYLEVAERVERALGLAGRQSKSVQVLPVSKGQSLETIQKFLEAFPNCRSLGENYLEELCNKKNVLDAKFSLQWHFLGRLQSRKIKDVLENTHVIHSVARRKELEILSSMALKEEHRFYLQFNVSEEATKGGFRMTEAAAAADLVERLGLKDHMLGLMTLASPINVVGEKIVEQEFSSLRELRDAAFPGQGLSMGMSADFELAIKHGATCLRLGSVLFGERS